MLTNLIPGNYQNYKGILALILFACQPALWGQTQLSTLRGTVTDQSGAVMAGVSITAEEIATEPRREV